MIPRDYITEWRAQAPWVSDLQVEQDLVISRALVELFARPGIARALVFRGGTALYKLHLRPAARYSEDIDLVQVSTGPMSLAGDSAQLADSRPSSNGCHAVRIDAGWPVAKGPKVEGSRVTIPGRDLLPGSKMLP